MRYTTTNDDTPRTLQADPSAAPIDGRGRSIAARSATRGDQSIGSAFLWAVAMDNGRADLAARIEDIETRYCRYSGEDGDVLSSVWSTLGWPMEVA